jgi:hypothetical protein
LKYGSENMHTDKSIRFRGYDSLLLGLGVEGDRWLGVITSQFCHNTCD